MKDPAVSSEEDYAPPDPRKLKKALRKVWEILLVIFTFWRLLLRLKGGS